MNEAAEAELKKKKDLHGLRLIFGEDTNESDAEKMEGVLKNLEPHENLEELRIKGYPGLHFPDWIARLSNLVDLTIDSCKNLRVLPDLSKLKSLETLWIYKLEEHEEMVTIGECSSYPNLKSVSIFSSPHSSLPKGFNRLTSIQRLELFKCETLDFELEELKHLTMLQKLWIGDCPILKERCGEGKDWRSTLSHVPKIYIDDKEITASRN
ncbi:hypothetical protein IFM89_024872 [Coptis chinensis]|uniref:R13L1/DRL21-like LRR repeat region domain-containing protein n=1 Tax=Coptis chinensis TaxID=261450 RepID=A0A835HJW0_9MAGN|nr:hypothetical protein IFM89_024872 [Coptis chinensis]